MNILCALVVIGAGLFCIICSVKEVSFFFNSRKAAFWVNLFGFKFAKILYIILGAGFVIAGILVLTGIVSIS